MTIENQDFTIYTGNDANLNALITEEDCVTPKNLTDATIIWVLFDDDIDVVLVTKTTTSGITITSPLEGLCTIALVEADTINLSPTKSYSHEAEVTDIFGNSTTVFTGKVIVKRSMI
jgi:hypothetical protein